MFCPKCGSEYREGLSRCIDCDVDLVATLPKKGPTVRTTVVVFETSDASLIPVVESVLRAARIEFVARGSALQGLFAGGQLGGINPVSRPMAFEVAADDAPRARKLLSRVAR